MDQPDRADEPVGVTPLGPSEMEVSSWWADPSLFSITACRRGEGEAERPMAGRASSTTTGACPEGHLCGSLVLSTLTVPTTFSVTEIGIMAGPRGLRA